MVHYTLILNCQLKNSDKKDELNVFTARFIYWWEVQRTKIAIKIPSCDNLKNSLIFISCLPSITARKGIIDVFFLYLWNSSPNLNSNLLSPCHIANKWWQIKPKEVTNVNVVPIQWMSNTPYYLTNSLWMTSNSHYSCTIDSYFRFLQWRNF